MYRLVTSLLVIVAAITFFVTMAVSTAQSHPNAAYWRESYAGQVLAQRWGVNNTFCQGINFGSHGMTQWAPEYYPRYQWFICSIGGSGQRYHTTSDNRLVYDDSYVS